MVVAGSSRYWRLGAKTLRGIAVVAVFLLVSHAGCSQNNLGVQVSELFERLDKTENELSEAKAMLTEKEAKLSAAEEKLREAEAKIREEKTKPNALKEPYREAMDKIAQLTQEVGKKEEQIKVLTAELKVFQNAAIANRQAVDIWGHWTWTESSTFLTTKKRLVILKRVGEENTAVENAVVKYQHDIAPRYASKPDWKTYDDGNCRCSKVSDDRLMIFYGKTHLLMQFTGDDHGLIWSDSEGWPKTEFGQPVQLEFRREE